MKTLAIVIGTILAASVLTIAAFAVVLYINAEEEEFSRGKALISPSSTAHFT